MRRNRSIVVEIPPCADRELRERLEADDEAWLMHVFGYRGHGSKKGTFWHPFTESNRAIVGALGNAFRFGGDYAHAEARGGGKSGIVRRTTEKHMLAGLLHYGVLFAASAPLAAVALASIKADLRKNPVLAALYPEVVAPIRALEGKAQRASSMWVVGYRHDNGERYEAHLQFDWAGSGITLPDVPGSPSANARLAACSLWASFHGLSDENRRPQVAIIDDPDADSDSLISATEQHADRLEAIIDAGIGGLGDQDEPVSRVMITTIKNWSCVSARYTDPASKPSWAGRRWRTLVKSPDRDDLWAEYERLARADAIAGDNSFRTAHAFYLAHKDEMDAGHEMGNPWRFDPRMLPDGTQREASALQAYQNIVIRLGRKAALTEYDNDPPHPGHDQIPGRLDADVIARRVNGLARRELPPNTVRITRAIDCGRRRLHWVEIAWTADGSGFVVDYGAINTLTADIEAGSQTDEQATAADLVNIPAAMRDLHRQWLSVETPHRSDATFIDCGWAYDAVRATAAELGWYPTKGIGQTTPLMRGGRQTKYNPGRSYWPGGYVPETSDGGQTVLHLDADGNVRSVHEQLRIAIGQAGAISFWGDAAAVGEHRSQIARHIVAQQYLAIDDKPAAWVRFNVNGTVAKTNRNGGPNHWLDCLGMALSAARLNGIRIGGQIQIAVPAPPPVEQQYVSSGEGRQRW